MVVVWCSFTSPRRNKDFLYGDEIRKLKVGYFGHIKRHESQEKHILETKVAGRRGRGRPMRRWEQDIQDWLETTTQAGRMAEDRVVFRKKIQEATSYKGSAD